MPALRTSSESATSDFTFGGFSSYATTLAHSDSNRLDNQHQSEVAVRPNLEAFVEGSSSRRSAREAPRWTSDYADDEEMDVIRRRLA